MSEEDQVKNILPTPSIETSEEIAFETSLFEKANWPNKTWWTQYGSNELNDLVAKALEANPTLQAVRERINFAASEATIARSKLFPLVYFNASDQWEYLSKNGLYRALNPTIPLNNQQIDLGLSFSYEFDFWSKYRHLFQAAVGKQNAAIAETAQAELVISASLAQSFFALRTNMLRKSYYEELLKIRQNYFALQERLLKNGVDSKLPPLLSQEAVYQAEQWIYEINRQIAVDKHVVNILAGRGPDTPLALNEPLLPLPAKLAIPSDISSELICRRPDLMAQIWRMDALAKEVGAAKAIFWPDINLVSFLGFESASWSKLFDWASKTISALPGLSLPVYTSGAIGANVDAKTAQYNEAVFQYNELILKSFQEVADLLAIGQAVYGEKEKQRGIVANATARYLLTRLKEKNGVDSALVAYRFQEEEILKKLRDIELLFEQYQVSISLMKALGGGYE